MGKFISDKEMDSIEPQLAKGAKFVSDDDMAKLETPAEPKYNSAQSAVMHGIAGLTGNFSDEIAGGVEAAGRALGVEGAGGPMKNMGLSADGPTLDWETLRDAYKAARDKERGTLKQQSDENPVASGLGDIGGAIASPLNKLAGGMGLMAGGATLGGVNALGKSDANSAGGMAADTAIGVGLGGALGGAVDKVKGLGPAVKGAVDDIATAPLGQEGERGLAAMAIDKMHRAGKYGNELVDKAMNAITPKTGNETADALLNVGSKVASKAGRYGVASHAQGTLDAMEQAPKALQWAAGKASPLMDKVSQSPFAQGLATRSPQVLESLLGKMGGGQGMGHALADEKAKPYDKNVIIQKTAGTKYAPVLQKAAQRGDQAFNAAYFVLQNNPDFRQSVKDQDEEASGG